MKKCAVFFCFLILLGAGCAVWFSPLCFVGGEAFVYENNAPIEALADAVCYMPSDVVRVDFDGSEDDMRAALSRIDAVTVERTELDGLVIVYAYSPRVCANALSLSGGGKYNVMAAWRAGKIAIGAPVLEGSY